MFFILNKPLYLTLLLLIPLIWFMMGRSSEDRLPRKKILVGVLRSSLIIVLGLALSDPKHLSHSDQVNVFFCLDVSESIPGDQRQKSIGGLFGQCIRSLYSVGNFTDIPNQAKPGEDLEQIISRIKLPPEESLTG